MLQVDDPDAAKTNSNRFSFKWLLLLLFPLPFLIGYYRSTTSWGYDHAVEVLRTNPHIIKQVGEPVEIDFVWKWKNTKVFIPFHGPLGSGEAVINAYEKGGKIVIAEFSARFDESKEVINLK